MAIKKIILSALLAAGIAATGISAAASGNSAAADPQQTIKTSATLQSAQDAPVKTQKRTSSAEVSPKSELKKNTESGASSAVKTEPATPKKTQAAESAAPPAPKPSETPAPKPKYTYTPADETVYTAVSLHVRDNPSVQGNIIRTASAHEKLHKIGVCRETGWIRIDGGYVSDKYVISETEEQARIAKEEAQKKAAEEAARKAAEASQKAEKAAAAQNTASTSVRYAWTVQGSTQADVDANRFIDFMNMGYYFAADIRSTYGKQIASLKAGDIVTVNGRAVQIDGEIHGNYNTDSVEDITARIGGARPAFQTCEPPYHGPIVVKYGHWL